MIDPRETRVLLNTLGKALTNLGDAQMHADEVRCRVEKTLDLEIAETVDSWWFELDALPARISGVMDSVEAVMRALEERN